MKRKLTITIEGEDAAEEVAIRFVFDPKLSRVNDAVKSGFYNLSAQVVELIQKYRVADENESSDVPPIPVV